MNTFRSLLASAVVSAAVFAAEDAAAVPFQMLVEVNPAFGNEIFVLVYDSLPDVIAANDTPTVTAHNLQTSANAAGFAFDGNQYHMLVEVDPAFGNGALRSGFG